MERRAYIALAGGLGATLTAGCLSALSGGSADTDEYIRNAEFKLLTAEEEFRRPEGDISTLTTRLDYSRGNVSSALFEANHLLDVAADKRPSDSEQAHIEYLQDYSSLLERRSELHDRLERALIVIDFARSYIDGDRVDFAREEIDYAEDEQEDAINAYTNAQETLDEIEPPDPLPNPEPTLTPHTQEQHFRRFEAIISTLPLLLEGYRYQINANAAYQDGLDAFEEGEDSESSDLFSEASGYYTDARSAYREAEDEAEGELKLQLITLVCEMERGHDSANKATLAAEESEHGDEGEAVELMAEASEILAESC